MSAHKTYFWWIALELVVASCHCPDPEEPSPTTAYCKTLPLDVKCGKCGAAVTSRTVLPADEYKCPVSEADPQARCSAAAVELGCKGTCRPDGCLVECPPRVVCEGFVDGSPLCEDCGSGWGAIYVDVSPSPSCGTNCTNVKDQKQCSSGTCIDSDTCELKNCKK